MHRVALAAVLVTACADPSGDPSTSGADALTTAASTASTTTLDATTSDPDRTSTTNDSSSSSAASADATSGTDVETTGTSTADAMTTDATSTGPGATSTSTTGPAPFCGDGQVDAGEECDDGNDGAGDGCSPACTVELECGKTFTTSWCEQVGPTDQHTRCESVEDAGRTCVNPEIRYGTNAGGVPQALGEAEYIAASLNAWCQQLGLLGWSDAVQLGERDCTQPNGPLAWSSIYDENVPHWSETGGGGNNGYWKGPGQKLNEGNWPCTSAIISVSCF